MREDIWPHLNRAFDELIPLIKPGARIVVVSPTGSGKTSLMSRLLGEGLESVLYTNRNMLREQTAEALAGEGHSFGIRAAGVEPDHEQIIQLASVQTEDRRSATNEYWDVHPAKLVLIDEAHVNTGPAMRRLIDRHLEQGAAVIGFTATPLDLEGIYGEMVIVAQVRELIASGVLVRPDHYAPDEPDTRKLKRTQTGEYTEGAVTKAIMSPTIVARVVDSWRRLNPEHHPTLCFGPGVPESLWLAQQFEAHGISAAHIDGDDVWMDRRFYPADAAARDELRERSKAGDIRIVCNRYVMREGIDWGWLRHGIFATIFGSLKTYLQSGGRMLRSHAGKERCTIQDHGGNWHRHGSLAANRNWELGQRSYVEGQVREERLRNKSEPEPVHCPRCDAIRLSRGPCFACGYEHHIRSRRIVQKDGTLIEQTGDIYKAHRISKLPRDILIDKWKQCYFRIRATGGTFAQARGLFQSENYWCRPPNDLPLMPKTEREWCCSIADIPEGELR